ncbi:glycoside hydrolase family 2 TIM barrel-domain containing protein [Demequina sp. NBRC 110054]|uniref:glycoside hydrolase family 2 TIM barrel-domain containing protein n=1 Tax=Demequina sp. NBRC 110054 TaxID=1570343 RepID=UPI000A0617CF|nr:glycoside hydrolase family 2 TIM barrel-domain containing protein [Demequina sp. NBRC 110054]
MTFDISRITDPEYVSEHRLAAHSDHHWYATADEAATGESSFTQCLNGLWKFHHAKNPSMTLAGFQSPEADVDGWDDIPVPAHVQMHGYDRPQYANVQYPWDGLEDLEPGQVPKDWNPVASYVKDFTLDSPLAQGENLSVTFHGAESGIAVWLNGAYVGWATDTFTPSEFDLTPHVRDGVNRLAAQVFRWTAASWLEDQDFYRFHGLFRDVVLNRRPAVHAEDVKVSTELAEDFLSAEITVDVALVGEGSVRATLVGVGPMDDAGQGRLVAHVDSPRLWSGEDPHRYEVLIEVLDGDGEVAEVVPQLIGLRRVEIADAIIRVNGKRIVFHGTNRHEFGARGRAMTAAEIEEDIRIIKRAGINAVRTSHYPNQSVFYELCDRYGLYVIDEMNLETHAMWDKVVAGELTVEQALPGDRDEWRAALLDRATSMLERDKNHPSVIIWSLGNESYGGSVLRDLSDWFRSTDPTRPVHYEGVHWDPRYPETTDITSQMYTPAATIEAHLKEHRDKPFLLCEYAHSMGNSFGAVDKYLDLADREPLFQGGFIWDFVDQTLPLTDRYDVPFKGYGGDCLEAPHDAEFSANGIVFSDRTPTPAYQEVRYLYQPFRTRISEGTIEIDNRRLFTDLSDLDVVVTLTRVGKVLREVVLDVDVPAGEQRTYPVPFVVPERAGEYTIDVSYRLKAATDWAPAGYEVGWEQEVVTVEPTAAPASSPAPAPRVVESTHNIGVHGSHFSITFSRLYGYLVSYRYGRTIDGGRELLRDVPYPSFWHAPTSNERGWGMPFRDGQWELASRNRKSRKGFEKPKVVRHESAVEVQFGYELPTVPPSEVDLSYTVDGDGHVSVTTTVRPGEGLPDVPEFGVLMTVDADLRRLTWYGEGPAESYVDRRGGARLGIYSADVRDQLTPYMRPQESGNHTGVRWAEVLDAKGFGVRLDCPTGMELSALPWTPFEVQNARHPNELPPIHRTILRPALMRRGAAGDDSWGAMTHPEYRVPEGELTFTFGFQGVLR